MDNCRQCTKQIDISRAINVEGILIHGPRKSASFNGRFCSCACLAVFTEGMARSVGREVGPHGSEPDYLTR